MDFNDIKNNPGMKNINPEKLNLLMEFANQANDKNPSELIPFFLAASSKADAQGMGFTNTETDLIMEILKQNMNDQEKKKLDMIKNLTSMISKKK